MIAEINGHVLRAAVEEAEKISHRVTGVQTDVTKESDVKRVVDRAVEAFGTVDVLFNNAGLNHAGLLHETTLEDWERVFDVNIKGMFLMWFPKAAQGPGRAVPLPVLLRIWFGLNNFLRHLRQDYPGTDSGRPVSRETMKAHLADAAAVVINLDDVFDREMMDAAPKLKAIASTACSAGRGSLTAAAIHPWRQIGSLIPAPLPA